MFQSFFSFFQIFGLYATFWPLKSLAFKCPSHFESRVTLKGPLDATRALSKIEITPSASWPFQLLGRPFWPYWPWNSKIWKSCNKRILKNPKMWKNYKLLLFFTFWPLIWPSQPSSAFYIFFWIFWCLRRPVVCQNLFSKEYNLQNNFQMEFGILNHCVLAGEDN